MGRGGGSTSGGGGGGGGFKLSKNPVVNGVFFAICAVIFAILTIFVPVYLVVSPAGDRCSVATSLNKGEQMFCLPKDLDETWEVDVAAPKDVKTYYVKAADVSDLKLTTRTVSWKYSTSLSEAYEYFSIASVYYCEAKLSVSCTGSKCDKVKMFWMTEASFDKSFDSNGDWDEDLGKANAGYYWKDFSSSQSFTLWAPSEPAAYNLYLVFSNHKEKGVSIKYNMDITYTVYDMSPFTPEKCGGDCEYDNMKTGDVIFVEYLDGKYDWMDASIHNNDINWSAVFASAAILAILTIICAILAVVYLYKVIKKGAKLAKKIDKKIEKEEKKQAEADAAAAAAAQPAYADPNYGQQPYPGQPYPGQM